MWTEGNLSEVCGCRGLEQGSIQFNHVSLLNSHLSFYPFSSFLQERGRDLVFVLQDYNVTCFKIADVLIAVLGAYQMLKLRALCVFPSACLYSLSQSSTLKLSWPQFNASMRLTQVDLVENLTHDN